MVEDSIVKGPQPGALINTTVGASFDETVKQFGSHAALVVRHQGIRWSYDELKKEVDLFADGLLAVGLSRVIGWVSGHPTTPSG